MRLHRIAHALVKDVGVTGNLDVIYGELGLEPAAMQEMQSKNQSSYNYMKAMLAEWKSFRSVRATWPLWTTCCGLADCTRLQVSLHTQ